MTVPRNPLARYTAWHLRIRRLIQFILAGAVYNNVLTNCAARLCRACLDEITCVAVMYLTLRISRERHGRKNPLPFPPFRSGHMSAICARLTDKGKVGVQRGRETAGVPSFLPPPRARQSPAHSAERNFPRFQLTTARKSGIIDTQYRKCDEETSFPSAVLQREDIRCKSLSGAENSHFRAVCN